jgi:hypothetical protein
MKTIERPAPSAWQVQRVVSLARETVETLRTEHGQVFDDADSLLAALVEEGVGVDDIIRRLIGSALNDKANAAGAKQRIADLQARKERFERHEEAKRGTVLAIMEALGLPKFVDPEFSLSVSTGKSKVIITSEAALSDDLVTVTTIRTPDKAKIKDAIEEWTAIMAELEDGDEGPAEVAGAILSNAPPVLTVRVR